MSYRVILSEIPKVIDENGNVVSVESMSINFPCEKFTSSEGDKNVLSQAGKPTVKIVVNGNSFSDVKIVSDK